MAKRSRDSTVSFGVIDKDGFVKVYYDGKVYAWRYHPSIGNIKDLTDERLYECEIIHNFERKPMINFTNIKTGDIALRQEVNRYEVRYEHDWLVDN